MASINDNLFTILLEHANGQNSDSIIQTQIGVLVLDLTNDGIRQMHYLEDEAGSNQPQSPLERAFGEWLAEFNQLAPEARWRYFDIKGTEFQIAVWRELNRIPFGETINYQSIAEAIGRPKANRAVGTAVGANPISVLIPCHRVIRKCRTIGNYRWGRDRKLALLDAEQQANSDLRVLFQ